MYFGIGSSELKRERLNLNLIKWKALSHELVTVPTVRTVPALPARSSATRRSSPRVTASPARPTSYITSMPRRRPTGSAAGLLLLAAARPPTPGSARQNHGSEFGGALTALAYARSWVSSADPGRSPSTGGCLSHPALQGPPYGVGLPTNPQAVQREPETDRQTIGCALCD